MSQDKIKEKEIDEGVSFAKCLIGFKYQPNMLNYLEDSLGTCVIITAENLKDSQKIGI